MRRFLTELRRRKVYHVGAVYVLVAFGVWQVADIAFPGLGLPPSAVTLVLVITILGFPIALVLAWAYEVRPESDSAPETPGRGSDDERGGDPSTVLDDADARPGEPVKATGASPSRGMTGAAATAGAASGPVPASASNPASDHALAETSIAVLPFENLGTGSVEEGFFADGMTEEITHMLARCAGVRVVARTSAFAFKGQATDVREVASRLGVSHVLEGSVRRSGARLRVTVQLIVADGGHHIWSERYDRESGDVFEIQDEIAAHVTRELAGRLPTDPGNEAAALDVGHRDGPTESVPAYEAYLRGRQVMRRFDPRSLGSAVQRFQEAIERDPGFAPAHAALAETLSTQSIGLGLASHDVMPAARAAADRALELDPGLSDAHVARALVSMFYERDYGAAKRGFDRALALNPNYADAYLWSEFYWTYVARVFESALAATLRAQELSPLDPSIRGRRGNVYFLFGRVDEAIEYLEGEVDAAPESPMLRLSLADALFRADRIDESLVQANLCLELFRTFEVAAGPLGVTGVVRARAGDLDGARELLGELERRAGRGFVTSCWQGLVHAGLGDLDSAFRCFDRACDEHDGSLIYIMAAPEWLGLRGDPRLPGILERLNLSHLLPEATG
ncbi:MAG: tetratricopeptide repeat protein [Gemmatimonadota bacterium]|nr:tetratricopeptide repeat protein [Gemmatimonadota bacterium]